MIGVVGLGFVGLTTAIGFAHQGFAVYGYDSDNDKREKFVQKVVPFHEPQLPEHLSEYLNKRFFLVGGPEEVARNSEVIFLCVGTPSNPDGSANLGILESAVRELLQYIKEGREYKTLVIKSTVPPSTTQEVIKPLIEEHGFTIGRDIGLANNPEFLREGHAWEDFIHPDRIVIGAGDQRSKERLTELYRAFGAPVLSFSLNTAEFIKYLSNTMLATMISFSNEMSMIAHRIGDIDIPGSFAAVHQDKRWSGSPAKMTTYVFPGCGFGGYCLPKDTQAMDHLAKQKGYDAGLLRSVLRINGRIKRHVVEKVASISTRRETIGILGLSFKPESDDVRESPSKDIIMLLLRRGYRRIFVYDPIAEENFMKSYKLPVVSLPTLEDIVKACDTLVILTAWDEFRQKRHLFKGKKVIDGRYMLKEGTI